ncbi:MAG: hypothetical protein KUG77_12765 [Nannocystaceae bacterium]|nr:hypothetical protein [Nannocystaceae bacterium]
MRLMLIQVVLLSLGCGARVPVADAYGKCDVEDDCEDAARCESSMVFSVCRPECTQDEDCPVVDGAVVFCDDDEARAGQCVIAPYERSCPTGMSAIAASASPSAPLICAWQE